jgi:hypothetical protein
MDKWDAEDDLTVEQFFRVLDGVQYPEYILDLVTEIQGWMKAMIHGEEDSDGHKTDPVAALFEEDTEPDVEGLFSRIEWAEEYADILPNLKRPKGKSEVVVVNISLPDLDSGMRMALDYAGIFNRSRTKRGWLLSDSFILSDMLRYLAHISALAMDGISVRYLLVTPWGWEEIPVEREPFLDSRMVWHNSLWGSSHNGGNEENDKNH